MIAYHFIHELQNHKSVFFFLMLRTSAAWGYFNHRIKLAVESQAQRCSFLLYISSLMHTLLLSDLLLNLSTEISMSVIVFFGSRISIWFFL